jgi:pimeloyl-ACP methyl ester carboxylesterase
MRPPLYPNAQMKIIATVFTLALMLSGCLPKADPSQPIPTLLVASPQTAPIAQRRLVVMLPGRADDLQALRRSGMAEAIQGAWPDADVLFAELTFQYYMQGRAPQRLHDEVIAPVRARGYREIWLGGASMGGMGTLMYERAYPGEMNGLVLLAPYVGDRDLLEEIRDAGGVAQWNPGPVQEVNRKTWQRELWRHLQTWSRDPKQAQRVWLAYGDKDRLREAMPQLTSLLPPGQVLVRDGGHTWTVWSPAAGEILRRAGQKKAAQ